MTLWLSLWGFTSFFSLAFTLFIVEGGEGRCSGEEKGSGVLFVQRVGWIYLHGRGSWRANILLLPVLFDVPRLPCVGNSRESYLL